MMREPKLVTEPHPEVARWAEYEVWPADKPFPLTPLEAWYVVQGYAVRPAAGLTREDFDRLPGRMEGNGEGKGGWLVIRG